MVTPTMVPAQDRTAVQPRVLVLARSYPNKVLPNLGLWTERPTRKLAQSCEVRVVSPVPFCPPLPRAGRLEQYARFRRISRQERWGGITVYHPRFVVGPATSLYRFEATAYYRAVRRLVDSLREEFPFDLIHAHFSYPDGVVAHRLAHRYRVPFLISEHAPWPGWMERGGVGVAAVPAAEAAAAVLAVSTSVREGILAYAPAARVRVVPVGVDEAMFHLPLPGEARHGDQMLFVGLVNYMKGVDVLLEAMSILKNRRDHGRLVLVGGAFYRDTKLQERRLRSLADDLELGDRVTFAGMLPAEEVARLMRQSAVVVLPSRAESFGSVIVEALASGTPAVATRCGGPEDILTEDVGVLVPPEDPIALADALADMLARAEDYQPERLRSFAIERFGIDGVAARTLDAYHDALTPAAAK